MTKCHILLEWMDDQRRFYNYNDWIESVSKVIKSELERELDPDKDLVRKQRINRPPMIQVYLGKELIAEFLTDDRDPSGLSGMGWVTIM